MDDDLNTVPVSATAVWLRTVLLLAAIAGLANGQGSLVILDPTISGDTVTLPIHLQGNVLDGVAALDFQLSYDASILQPIQVHLGDAAANAGKEVQARLLADGQYVVLMFGLGRNAVAQGEVARVALNKLSDPKEGQTPVTIANTKFATISGVEIPSQGSTTTLLFESESGNGSGDAGGLPPIFGGGPPTGSNGTDQTSTRNTEPAASESAAGGPAKSGDALSVDLAKARALADDRLSMLRGAQEEREAARAAVGQPPARSGRESGIRVRQASASSGRSPAGPLDSPRASVDERASTNKSTARTGIPGRDHSAQRGGADQTLPLSEELRVEPVETVASGMESPIVEVETTSDAALTRGLRLRAGFVAACLAIAVGVFVVRRRRGA